MPRRVKRRGRESSNPVPSSEQIARSSTDRTRDSAPGRRAGSRAVSIAVGALGLAVLVSLVNPRNGAGATSGIDLAAKLTAIGAACVLGAWLEDRVFARAQVRGRWTRFSMVALMPPASLLVTPI